MTRRAIDAPSTADDIVAAEVTLGRGGQTHASDRLVEQRRGIAAATRSYHNFLGHRLYKRAYADRAPAGPM